MNQHLRANSVAKIILAIFALEGDLGTRIPAAGFEPRFLQQTMVELLRRCINAILRTFGEGRTSDGPDSICGGCGHGKRHRLSSVAATPTAVRYGEDKTQAHLKMEVK